MAQLFVKDPSATLDYQISWATWLGTDTISASTWTVPSGLSSSADTSTTTTATVWLAGGTAGTTYEVKNTITTTAGRIDERTIAVLVDNK